MIISLFEHNEIQVKYLFEKRYDIFFEKMVIRCTSKVSSGLKGERL